jgi:hypothetical protein
MPYVSVGRLQTALQSLTRFHAFFGVTFLSMKRSGVPIGTPAKWGSPQENEVLQTYYAPPGAPPKKPYFVPFGQREPKTGWWRAEDYSGSTLQSARTRDKFKPALIHPDKQTWAFAADHLDVLEAQLPKDDAGNVQRIPVFDLTAWLYRADDLPSDFKKIEKKFRDDFHVDDATYKRLFIATKEDAATYFFADPIPNEELIRLTEGIPEGPSLLGRSEDDLLTALETYVSKRALLELPDGFVRSFYYALKTQRFVVLAGRPGTGKTAFALAFARGLKGLFGAGVNEIVVAVGPDAGESDIIGYEKITGSLAATDLTRHLFLGGRKRDVYVVVLDEMNLAPVDNYFARLLPALESDAAVELPGDGGRQQLPPDTYVIGTINSFVEESTRLPLSGPVKRRANVIEMPNLLSNVLANDDKIRFGEIVVNLVQQTRNRLASLQAEGRASVLDQFRVESLDAALKPGSPIRASFVETLWRICKICALDTHTSLTMGVLQDVADFAAMRGGDPVASLDEQIAYKIVPQLSGPAQVPEELLVLVSEIEGAPGKFGRARAALTALLRTKDPSSGNVLYTY